MKIVKRTSKNAIAKLDKGEGFEGCYKYMVICNYDEEKEYDGMDGDIYKCTYKEALRSAFSWEWWNITITQIRFLRVERISPIP